MKDNTNKLTSGEQAVILGLQKQIDALINQQRGAVLTIISMRGLQGNWKLSPDGSELVCTDPKPEQPPSKEKK